VTGMALRWLLLGSSGTSLDAGWDFFFVGTRGREGGARDDHRRRHGNSDGDIERFVE